MKRVLVTGATGFTAQYVIPLLARAGFEVWGVSRSGGSGARDLVADITDPCAIEDAVARVRPTHVVHLAGTQNLPDSQVETLHRVNVQGAKNLLEACIGLPERPQRVLIASSAYVYGDTGDAPATEDRGPAPAGEYGKSKLEMEQVALRLTNRLPILIVRPFNYTGVGHDERFLVPKLVRVFRDGGNDISFVASHVTRDFSDVRWVSWVYVELLGASTPAGAMNVCSGVPTSLQQLVELLERLVGHRPSARPADPAVGTLVGAPHRLQGCLRQWNPIPFRETLQWMLAATG